MVKGAQFRFTVGAYGLCCDIGFQGFFTVASNGPPHLVASYNKQGVPRTYSNPDTLGVFCQ
jgi:hypothetical protein